MNPEVIKVKSFEIRIYGTKADLVAQGEDGNEYRFGYHTDDGSFKGLSVEEQ